MHPALIEAHSVMMPRLQAEEDMRCVRNVALGAGKMERHDARQAHSALRKQAEGGRRRRGRVATAGDLASAGVGVRRVPRKGA